MKKWDEFSRFLWRLDRVAAFLGTGVALRVGPTPPLIRF